MKKFVKEVPIRYCIGRDPTAELAGQLGITVIPHTIIVDRPGRITFEGHPEAPFSPGTSRACSTEREGCA